MVIQILLAALSIMLVSLVGVATISRRVGSFLSRRLSYLVAFSAGVFLVTAGAMALEVYEIFAGELWIAILLIVAGYLLAAGLEWLWPEVHHHHNDECDHGHERRGARKLLVGDAIHNIGDGIILVPAFLASPALGLAVTVSVMVHEVLQEMSEFFVLRQAGYSIKKALLVNFAVSSTVFIGVGLSFAALTTHNLEGLLLAVSAGFFIHVVTHDLLPRPSTHSSFSSFLGHVGMVVIGLVMMAVFNLALSGGHEHSHLDQHDHDERDHDAEGHRA